jgi:glutaminyl-tRNA synthetase
VKATIHWISAPHALEVEVRLYDRLFTVEDLSEEKERDFKEFLNPESLVILPRSYVEPSLKDAAPLSHWQFERVGYFNVDPDSGPGRLVFNRTVALKDSWSKEKK